MRLLVYTATGVFLVLLALLLLPAPANADQDGRGADSGILSEIRVGAMRHDAGVLVGRKETDAVDANVEILFTSPGFLKHFWSPRPHLGVTGNFTGDTSQAYLGLTWDIDLFAGVFFELGLGASVHNGNRESGGPTEKKLGCRWLYRESVALGYRISEVHNVSVMLDHVSNNDRCDRNPGMDTLGIRWGYRF